MASEKKIYLIRHGETEFNREKILQGSKVDLGLNETGRRQAVLFYKKYHLISFKKIYTSPQKRSIESVELFINKGIPHEVFSELREISYGQADGKLSPESSLYKNLNSEWGKGNLSLKIQGGESPLEVQARIKRFINYILNKEEDLILISTHGRTMRILLATMLGYDLRYMHLFKHSNMCLYIIINNEGEFYLDKYNDISHLKDPSIWDNVFKIF